MILPIGQLFNSSSVMRCLDKLRYHSTLSKDEIEEISLINLNKLLDHSTKKIHIIWNIESINILDQRNG